MRPRLNPDEKRNCPIGIKVKQETRDKLEFIAAREAHPLSTQIDLILKDYIERYFEIAKINWNEYAPQRENTEGGDIYCEDCTSCDCCRIDPDHPLDKSLEYCEDFEFYFTKINRSGGDK